jgi:hypothetical protein
MECNGNRTRYKAKYDAKRFAMRSEERMTVNEKEGVERRLRIEK